MPQNRFEQITFAVLTVIVTVHAYVFTVFTSSTDGR